MRCSSVVIVVTMRVLCCDVGIKHLGMVEVDVREVRGTVTRREEIERVVGLHLVDITKFTCDRIHCELDHERCMCSWMDHLVATRPFVECDVLLVERQPPEGLQVVEKLLKNHLRDKFVYVNPRSMHKHFGIGRLEYDDRKRATVRVAEEALGREIPFKRKHDVGDAYCLLVFWLEGRNAMRVGRKRSRFFVQENRRDVVAAQTRDRWAVGGDGDARETGTEKKARVGEKA